jgi:hypothetical protein
VNRGIGNRKYFLSIKLNWISTMNRRRTFRIERLEPRAMLSASGDFNGDGFDDLAIGAPGESVSGADEAGAVHVLFGSNGALTATGNQLWSQQTSGINSVAHTGENFGEALAVGDFDGDGFDDLAIGVFGEAVDGLSKAGGVNVIYGSASGLTATGDQFWTRSSSGINGLPAAEDFFGTNLTAGDFDGDGFDDLAIASPNDSAGALSRAGAVNVIYGRASGLNAGGDQLWTQDSSGIDSVPHESERFGQSLSSGDFNGDGRDDLVVGSEDLVGDVEGAGAVNVIYGTAAGLTSSGDQLWSQGVTGISGEPGVEDSFSRTLATGDFNGDSFDDLAIGVQFGEVGGDEDAGEVNVLYGSAAKIQIANQQLITRDSLGGTSVTGENFGDAMAAGDFDGDGRDDLAIGASEATVGGVVATGYVQIVYGTMAGLSAAGTQFMHQNTSGVLDSNEEDDGFGTALVSGDYNNDGRNDLAIGVSGEEVGGFSAAGQVAILLGSVTGITTTSNQIWNAGSTGILGLFEQSAGFGRAVA